MSPDNHDYDSQLSRTIFHRFLSAMKFTLDLEEQKYPERGRHDDRYKFFKKQLMSNTYENIRALLKNLEELNFIQKTDYPEDVKDGYKPTSSGGSGFVNTDQLDAWLKTVNE